MPSKRIWFMVLAVVLILVAGIMLFRFTSSHGDYPGEDIAQFALGTPSNPSK